MDLARSIQVITEEVMLKMTKFAHSETGMKKLCLAGGVALNCVANGRVLREVPFEDIWIQPAAGDAGGALGIALADLASLSGKATTEPRESRHLAVSSPQWRSPQRSAPYADGMKGSYLGPKNSEEEIEAFLKSQPTSLQKILARRIAGSGC